jgi:hypothetical protein
MMLHASEAFGSLGVAVVETWQQINATGFENRLQPIPIVLVQTLPFGQGLSRCDYASEDTDGWRSGRCITLVVAAGRRADNSHLLHSMIHQHIYETLGEDPRHSSAAWRAEIMRLHSDITGETIWAGPSITARQGRYRVVRLNLPGPEGQPSLSQKQIAEWPAGFQGIDLGPLGGVSPP